MRIVIALGAIALGSNCDIPSDVRVLRRIGEEVRDHLAQPRRIASDGPCHTSAV